MLGISTCWWAQKEARGDIIAREALALGFQGIELEYRLSERMVRQMAPFLGTQLAVLSVHNYFPRADGRKGGGDLFLLSSKDSAERSAAVEGTIQTIEYAHKLGARAVVLHLGRVDIPQPTDDWISLVQQKNATDQKREAFLQFQQMRRKACQKENLDAVLFSLDRLNQVAEEKGLWLGIENRYHFNEIPSFEEIGVILDTFKGGRIGYWHDVGHAHALEQLGVIRQQYFLEAYGDRIVGVHLHDAQGFDDHQSPGMGEIDFARVLAHVPPAAVKIMEIHPSVSKQAVIAGVKVLETCGLSQEADE